MRVTLDIDDDVLMAVNERARRQRRSVGDVLSEITRQGLSAPESKAREAGKSPSFYGFDPLPPRGTAVSNDLIDRLRDA